MSTISQFQKLLKDKPVIGIIDTNLKNGHVVIEDKSVSTSNWRPIIGLQIGDKVLYPFIPAQAKEGFNDGNFEFWRKDFSIETEQAIEDEGKADAYTKDKTYILANYPDGNAELTPLIKNTTVSAIRPVSKRERENLFGAPDETSTDYRPNQIILSNGTRIHCSADSEHNWPAGFAITSKENFLTGVLTPEALLEAPDFKQSLDR